MQRLDDSRPSEPDSEPQDAAGRSPWEPPREGEEQGPPAYDPRQDGDAFARLNALAAEPGGPAEAGDGPQPVGLPLSGEPPFLVEERDLLGEPRRAPSKAATFAAFVVVALAVLGVLMTIAAVKLFTERAAMADTLAQSVDRLEVAYAGQGSTDTEKRRIEWLRKSIADGDFGQAHAALEQLGEPAKERPSPLDRPNAGDATEGQRERGDRELPSPRQDRDLPLKAQVFFEQHEELWEAFFGFSVAIARMEQREMEVGELKQLRAGMVEAAEAGQAQKVEQLLRQAQERMQGDAPGRGNEQLPPTLQRKVQQFGAAMQQAQRERRDPRQAVAFAQRSERAAQQGDFKRAEQLMDRAITALRTAPRAQAQRRPERTGRGGPQQPRNMPQMGPEIGLIRFVADVAMNVMRAEERDFETIWESINTAAGAIRENNADQIREILGQAQDAFSVIAGRRRQMQGAIQQAQEQMQQGRPGAGQERPEGQQRPAQQVIVERVSEILTKVREMPEEEFTKSRMEIARAVLAAMTAPMRAEAGREEANLTPEQRVSMKMERAGSLYQQLRKQPGHDLTQIDATFRKVRGLITEHQYERAEGLIDEALGSMQAMAAEAGDGGGDPLQFNVPDATLDLREATEAPDVTEGAEQ